MRTRWIPPVAVAVAAVLAGCSGEPAAAPVDDADFSNLDLQASSTTGILRGVVVDEAIRPIANASVVLNGADGQARATTTTADGLFGFQNLPPGSYFATASKLGYSGSQVGSEVVAGVAEPPIVKILLTLDPTTAPFVMSLLWEGFIECSMRVRAADATGTGVGFNACSTEGGGIDPFPNQYAEFPVPLSEGAPALTQSELIWEDTQTLGSGLTLVVGPPDCRDVKYDRADGASPLVIRMNQTLLLDESEDAEDEGFNPEEGICYRVFSWVAEESANTLGVVTSQRFAVYIHGFYNFLPPEGWQFSVDGPPVVPQ